MNSSIIGLLSSLYAIVKSPSILTVPISETEFSEWLPLYHFYIQSLAVHLRLRAYCSDTCAHYSSLRCRGCTYARPRRQGGWRGTAGRTHLTSRRTESPKEVIVRVRGLRRTKCPYYTFWGLRIVHYRLGLLDCLLYVYSVASISGQWLHKGNWENWLGKLAYTVR